MTGEILLNTGGRTCRIFIGSGILAHAGELIGQNTSFRRFAVITNPTVKGIYGDVLEQNLESAKLSFGIFEVPDSENSKSLDAADKLYGELADGNYDRDSCIIALGGGAVGDLAGFVAATYMRGIGLIHVPTTLLAQADSSVGGKTAVNIPQGKNLVGVFHQPELVISDVSLLRTLPDADFRSGIAEIVKYAMISDSGLFSLLEENRKAILGMDFGTLENIVTRCVNIKAETVEKDERDRGLRNMLNLGHTLGHALESASDYSYSHGAAVSAGMVFAARVSVKLGLMEDGGVLRLSNLLREFGLPVFIDSSLDTDDILRFMASDKKASGGEIRMVLPAGIGREPEFDSVSRETLLATMKEMMQ